MPIQEETVYEALRRVQDPELMVNIVDLGLIYGVEVEEIGGKSNLLVIMTMTTPACSLRPGTAPRGQERPKRLPDAGSVGVRLTMSPPWTPDRMTEDARDKYKKGAGMRETSGVCQDTLPHVGRYAEGSSSVPAPLAGSWGRLGPHGRGGVALSSPCRRSSTDGSPRRPRR